MTQPINKTAVLMAAVHIFTQSTRENDSVWFPTVENRSRDAAMDEAARMAWSLAETVERFAPEPGKDNGYRRAPSFRPAPWEVTITPLPASALDKD